jgi:hypothetical protein
VATRTDTPAAATTPAARRSYAEIKRDLDEAQRRLRELLPAAERERARVAANDRHIARVQAARRRALASGLDPEDLELDAAYRVPPPTEPNPVICSDLHAQHYVVADLERELMSLGSAELAFGRHAELIKKFGREFGGPPVAPADLPGAPR